MTSSFDTFTVFTTAEPSTISHSAHRSHWHLTHHYPISYRSHCRYRLGYGGAIRLIYCQDRFVNLLVPPPHHHRFTLAFVSLHFTVGLSSIVYLSKAFNQSMFLIKTAPD